MNTEYARKCRKKNVELGVKAGAALKLMDEQPDNCVLIKATFRESLKGMTAFRAKQRASKLADAADEKTKAREYVEVCANYFAAMIEFYDEVLKGATNDKDAE